jgi:hypothetical protein
MGRSREPTHLTTRYGTGKGADLLRGSAEGVAGGGNEERALLVAGRLRGAEGEARACAESSLGGPEAVWFPDWRGSAQR